MIADEDDDEEDDGDEDDGDEDDGDNDDGDKIMMVMMMMVYFANKYDCAQYTNLLHLKQKKKIEKKMDVEQLDALFAGAHYDVQQYKQYEKMMQTAMETMKSNLVDKFEALVAKQPKSPFVVFEGLIYSYETIDKLACQVACVVKTWSLQPQDCVGIMIHNEPSFFYTFFGLQKLGIPVALISTQQTGQSLVHSLKVGECRALIVGAG
ncbi:long-chain fatty acid transport protein 6 [Elysia marginata]|uniref:Long-chain-fatty-acid--CoA ligase n=1 Tax=Elysia marginata TaxID=1093978 RepID=A0AAV4G2W9_9GAST|nr:long-chain fatty acid transport protein 6 [Elysia marginata]